MHFLSESSGVVVVVLDNERPGASIVPQHLNSVSASESLSLACSNVVRIWESDLPVDDFETVSF